MNKSELLNDPNSCLSKARPLEPVFLLRANDPMAAQTIRLWAAQNEGKQPPDKIAEALDIAEAFDLYHTNNVPKCTDNAPHGAKPLRPIR